MTVVSELNQVINALNKVNPTWYVALTGPLATVAQHFLKKEHDFAKDHGVLVSVILAGGAGAFFGVLHTSTVQGFLATSAVTAAPIYAIANLLFQNVSSKVEQLNSLPTAPAASTEAPVAPVAAPLATPDQPDQAPAQF